MADSKVKMICNPNVPEHHIVIIEDGKVIYAGLIAATPIDRKYGGCEIHLNKADWEGAKQFMFKH